MKTAIIILTRNAENYMDALLSNLQSQTLDNKEILVIDSKSNDKTIDIIKKHGIKYHQILPSEFNHGKTRQLALSLVDADIYLYMTQDALPASDEALENLIKAFDDPKVACAYGRQLPKKDATILETHARIFNYPEHSLAKTFEDRKKLGIKTCFNSDSFAAYRKTALEAIGGFPEDIILGEDMYVAAKFLMNGWKVAYQADAMVYHSHSYTFLAEFKRYFDIGVFHRQAPWILKTFAKPTGEGKRYVQSEWKYCLKKKAYLTLAQSFFATGAKFLGYKLGLHYQKLPKKWLKHLIMCSFYWD